MKPPAPVVTLFAVGEAFRDEDGALANRRLPLTNHPQAWVGGDRLQGQQARFPALRLLVFSVAELRRQQLEDLRRTRALRQFY